MGKFDSFFSEEAPQALNKKILGRAQAEMEMLKKKDKKSSLIGYLMPIGSFLTIAVLAFYLNTGISKHKMTEGDVAGLAAMAVMGHEFVGHLLEEDEGLEMVDELGVLEEFENLVEMSDGDLEG